ncbi:hypothetical protein PIB30_087228 [Stylosanthes scabra]|uniref:Uncharacterized protein n=1 Tax=Stylosanthes scabra TaxID=79078 RepID=A0ABU6WTD4_9FABA|nr:hypothetical protein [Stylosanthes scabra]
MHRLWLHEARHLLYISTLALRNREKAEEEERNRGTKEAWNYINLIIGTLNTKPKVVKNTLERGLCTRRVFVMFLGQFHGCEAPRSKRDNHDTKKALLKVTQESTKSRLAPFPLWPNVIHSNKGELTNKTKPPKRDMLPPRQSLPKLIEPHPFPLSVTFGAWLLTKP